MCGAGGLIFGWNALTLMLKQQGNYLGGCDLPQNRAPLARLRAEPNRRLCVLPAVGLC